MSSNSYKIKVKIEKELLVIFPEVVQEADAEAKFVAQEQIAEALLGEPTSTVVSVEVYNG